MDVHTKSFSFIKKNFLDSALLFASRYCYRLIVLNHFRLAPIDIQNMPENGWQEKVISFKWNARIESIYNRIFFSIGSSLHPPPSSSRQRVVARVFCSRFFCPPSTLYNIAGFPVHLETIYCQHIENGIFTNMDQCTILTKKLSLPPPIIFNSLYPTKQNIQSNQWNINFTQAKSCVGYMN